MRLCALLACVALVSCSGGGGSVVSRSPVAWRGAVAPASRLPGGSSVIQHVVVVIQENRSFDNLFQGYPGANTASSGKTSTGGVVALQPISFTAPFDPSHQFGNALADMDGGKMDGFDKENKGCTGCPPLAAYAYVPASETVPYFNMAGQYVLADDFFASDEDGSFVSHQYLIAAQANDTFGLPSRGWWGCDSPNGTIRLLNPNTTPGTPTKNTTSVCFDPYATLADEIDAAPPLTWRFYAAKRGTTGYFWSAFDAVGHIRNGPEWTTNVFQNQRFFSDLSGGTLASVTWITPNFAASDHPKSKSTSGPAWVTRVVDAVGQSKFWNSTVVFVLWDDWGGWYDHVPPPVLDFDGLGIRTPLLVISPYSLTGVVAHSQYEFGSILGFVEQNFGLAPLGASDARANPFAGGDVFDFTQPARPFVPF